ncbi:phe13-bombesin receptor-like [Anneissia japonica]|uniref:phe13-bombesin receptor-like n=1 Tax=Anneissia japonica TaxID=1529436 RepID=UPI001425A27B|nr:phe13-bombesin receptor-like [Anneissia japonica]
MWKYSLSQRDFRCYVLIYPLRVRTVITLKKKLLVTSSIWVISILCSIHVFFKNQLWQLSKKDWLISSVNDEFDEWQPPTQYIIPVVIVVVSCIIASVTLIKRIGLHSNRLQESSQSNVSRNNSLRVPKRALVTVTIVAVVFLCMTSPNAICRYMVISKGYMITNFINWQNMWFITNILRISNSCVNPFIYTLMSRSFRSAIKSAFCCKTDSTIRQNHIFNSRRHLQNRV